MNRRRFSALLVAGALALALLPVGAAWAAARTVADFSLTDRFRIPPSFMRITHV